ncbi:DUF6115 domain-containing protein [Paenibacillus sp. GCM10023250]|uniref:DUF6115 domain-containing protein n=1 Tax=Paenibacillus sp. GCM10023250 TaxID=3252648 RepID=UPI003619AF7B
MEPWQTIMLLGGFAIVCAAVLPRRKNAGGGAPGGTEDRDRAMRGMETALEQFMENMEADDREIADLVGKSAQEARAMAAERDERIDRLEARCAELAAELTELQRLQASNKTAPALYNVRTQQEEPVAPAAEQPASAERHQREETRLAVNGAGPDEDAQSDSIRGRYSELFELHSAGKSVEAIAKKLGRHKGEVQLILQLAKQEEAAR